MKMTTAHTPPVFQPITITITVESQEERLALLAYTSKPNSVAAGTLTYPMTNNEQKTMRNFLRILDTALMDRI